MVLKVCLRFLALRAAAAHLPTVRRLSAIKPVSTNEGNLTGIQSVENGTRSSELQADAQVQRKNQIQSEKTQSEAQRQASGEDKNHSKGHKHHKGHKALDATALTKNKPEEKENQSSSGENKGATQGKDTGQNDPTEQTLTNANGRRPLSGNTEECDFENFKSVKEFKECLMQSGSKYQVDMNSEWNLVYCTLTVILTFYFTNAPSTEIRVLTWNMLDLTFSIVSAIVLARIVETLSQVLFGEEDNFYADNIAAVVFTSLILNWTMVYCNYPDKDDKVVFLNAKGVKGYFSRSAWRTASHGPTAGRLHGLSVIYFWSEVQQGEQGEPSAIAVHVPWIALFSGVIYLAVVRFIRIRVLLTGNEYTTHDIPAPSAAPAPAPARQHTRPRTKNWELRVCSWETAGWGLAVSFLTAQVARYKVSGTGKDFPSVLGGIRAHAHLESGMILALLYIGIISAFLTPVRLMQYFYADRPPDELCPWHCWAWNAFLEILGKGMTLLSGWMLLYATIWTILLRNGKLWGDTPDANCSFRFRCALIQTLMGLVFICLLASLDVSKSFSKVLMGALSISIGFAWRRVFGMAVDSMMVTYAGQVYSTNPRLGEILIQIGVCIPLLLLLMPMRFFYLSPKLLDPSKGDEAPASTPVTNWLDTTREQAASDSKQQEFNSALQREETAREQ